MDYNLIFSSLVIFYTTFSNINWSNQTLAGWVYNGALLLFVLINIRIFKNFFDTRYVGINICVLILAIIMIYSGYANADIVFDRETWDGIIIESLHATRPDHAIYTSLKFISFPLYLQYLNKYSKDRLFLRYFFTIFLVYTIISNFNAIIYNSPDGGGYLVGNKFFVCYNNILLITLYFMRYPLLINKKNIIIRLKSLLLISLLISIKTECSTGVIGTILMYIFIFKFNNSWKKKLYKWQTYLLLLLTLDILFFFYSTTFLNNPIAEFIVVDILGEDLTLSGRLNIYAALVGLLKDCPLWGYGIGNSHVFTIMNGIGPNAQNGLFNLMLEVGILGCISFLLMIFMLLKLSRENKFSYPIICLMYTMLILSSVEITFSIMIISMIMMLILNNNPGSDLKLNKMAV